MRKIKNGFRSVILSIMLATLVAACSSVTPDPEAETDLQTAAVGDFLGEISLPGISAVGGAFDGTYYYAPTAFNASIINVYTLPASGAGTATLVAQKTLPLGVVISNIAWDKTRNTLWAAGQNKVYLLDIGDPAVSGAVTATFKTTYPGIWLVDGLAYDPSDDTIYVSPDGEINIHQYKSDGAFVRTLVLPFRTGGITIGSDNTLYIAEVTTNIVRRVSKTDGTVISQFQATFHESLACDTVTYAVDAIHVRVAGNPMRAYEVESGTCPLAGGTNTTPTVGVDAASVTVDEGQTATNTGTYGDSDGDSVTLAVSSGAGTVVDNGDGTWSWSFATTDGPTESQSITIDASDGTDTTQVSFGLTVNNVAPTVDSISVPLDPVNINEQTGKVVSATFSDPAGTADAPYTCTIDYGDGAGPQAGVVSGTSCEGDLAYLNAGVYEITVAIEDKDGGVGSAIAETYVVIYDPSDGFVTGGGWIDSESGAYTPDDPLDEDFVGKASFGFVSKYKKGASIPTGNTQFQFQAGDLNFHSSLYEWLVITQQKTMAQYKGSGTINGASAPVGDYKFVIWAGDNTTDTFRIRIWWEDASALEHVVYDNGFNQDIDGGSIKIHAK